MTELFAEQLVELETLRKQRDWSYAELADDVEKYTKRRRDQDCFRKLCTGLTHRPNSRTVDIIETYLGAQRENGASRRPRRRSVA
jgi:hypothetical protein